MCSMKPNQTRRFPGRACNSWDRPSHRTIGCMRMRIFFFVTLAAIFWAMGTQAKTVTDQLGRQFEVPETPRRVVALAPNITEIVFALERQDALVGVSRFSDYPKAAQNLPKVGSYVHLDLERIVALQPDLCIAIKDGNPKAVADRLELMGIPVYAVDPKGLGTMLTTVSEIGRLLNADRIARRLVSDLEQRVARVDRLVAKAAYKPRVFFQIGISPIVSAGSRTFINELIVRAGGVNLARGAISYPRFSTEQVLSLAPEVMIITSMARVGVFKEVKSNWMKWKMMPAARDQRIYIQESNLFDRPTPRLVDGLELLTQLIHPELYEAAP